jgi:hypothetical protein
MIVVTATLTATGQIVFQFQPEPSRWILHGTSLARIEEAIRNLINTEMPEPRLEPNTAERITNCAQRVLNALVERSFVSEG